MIYAEWMMAQNGAAYKIPACSKLRAGPGTLHTHTPTEDAVTAMLASDQSPSHQDPLRNNVRKRFETLTGPHRKLTGNNQSKLDI